MGAINIEYVLISDVFNLYVELTKSMQWQRTQGEPKSNGKTRLSKGKEEKCVSNRNKMYEIAKWMIFDLSIQSALIICFSIIYYMNNNNSNNIT